MALAYSKVNLLSARIFKSSFTKTLMYSNTLL